MNRSSYKEHLLLKHPSENSNDPRGFCPKVQSKIDFSKSRKSGSNSKQKRQQEQENQDQDKEHEGREKEHRQEEQGPQGQQEQENQDQDKEHERREKEHRQEEQGLQGQEEQDKEHEGREEEHRQEEQRLQGQQVEEGQLELDSTLECDVLHEWGEQEEREVLQELVTMQDRPSHKEKEQEDVTMQGGHSEEEGEKEEDSAGLGEGHRKRARYQRRRSDSSKSRSRSPPKKSRGFEGSGINSSQDGCEMRIDEEELHAAIDKVRHVKNISMLDLEEIVKEGREEELIDVIEETTKSDEVKNLSKEKKVIMMSNIQKVVELEDISKEVEERAVAAGLILLAELATENWRKVSAAEAKVFKRILVHTTVSGWVRAVFWGLLTSAEEATLEADREEGETEADLEKVSKKLDVVVNKILVNPPDLSEQDTMEKCEAKIDIIEKQLNVSKVAGDLQKAVQQLKEISCMDKMSVDTEDEVVTKEALKSCRDVDQISDKISEFHCQGGVVRCRVCPDARSFKYSQDLQTRGEHQLIPVKLSNLKKSLQDHLSSNKHKKRVTDARCQEDLAEQKFSRNKTIGLKLGKVVYMLAHHGLPFTLYPEMVQLLADFKVDIGDINHSPDFCRDLGPSLAKVFNLVACPLNHSTFAGDRDEDQEALVHGAGGDGGEAPSAARGRQVHLPALVSSHAYFCEIDISLRTRQITGGVTLMPGSPALIQAVYFESPKCPSGTGDFMAAKITEVADKWIEPDQYQGSVGDGVYRHCSVPQKLDEHYDRKGLDTWDGMHVAATVGTGMRADKKFSWLGTIDETMGKGNNFINFGASWHKLNEVGNYILIEN